MNDNSKVINNVVTAFSSAIRTKCEERLESFYLVGSYTQGKTSQQHPDINYLLVFKDFTSPQDYLNIGKVCHLIEDEFKNDATIRYEFRPFRYIKPRYVNDFEISINPIIISEGEINAMGGVIFNKWFTEGLINSNELIVGSDFLSTFIVDPITREDIQKGVSFDLAFFTIPVSRAPAQYTDSESNLLLNESLVNAKNIAYLGIEAAMNDEELLEKAYLKYIHNKDEMVLFYQERYGEDVSVKVERILEVRNQYTKYKQNPKVAEELFGIALTLGNEVRRKVYSDSHK